MLAKSISFRVLLSVGTLLIVSGGLTGCSRVAGGKVYDWKEDVVLHDGKHLSVTRKVRVGGHNVMHPSNYTDQTISFTAPSNYLELTWSEPFKSYMGGTTLIPLTVDIKDGAAYISAIPVNCIAYTYWGRPNPPYVIFRNTGGGWQRIGMENMPTEFSRPNIIVSDPAEEIKRGGTSDFSARQVNELNKGLRYIELKKIVREPGAWDMGLSECPQYTYKNGTWSYHKEKTQD